MTDQQDLLADAEKLDVAQDEHLAARERLGAVKEKDANGLDVAKAEGELVERRAALPDLKEKHRMVAPESVVEEDQGGSSLAGSGPQDLAMGGRTFGSGGVVGESDDLAFNLPTGESATPTNENPLARGLRFGTDAIKAEAIDGFITADPTSAPAQMRALEELPAPAPTTALARKNGRDEQAGGDGNGEAAQKQQLEALAALNAAVTDELGETEIGARVAQYEMGYRLQAGEKSAERPTIDAAEQADFPRWLAAADSDEKRSFERTKSDGEEAEGEVLDLGTTFESGLVADHESRGRETLWEDDASGVVHSIQDRPPAQRELGLVAGVTPATEEDFAESSIALFGAPSRDDNGAAAASDVPNYHWLTHSYFDIVNATEGKAKAGDVVVADGTYSSRHTVHTSPSSETTADILEVDKISEIREKEVAQQAPTSEALDLETATSDEPFSTFSLNVSDVSFKLAQASLLEQGTWPDPAQIRPEEFVNAFDYGDPMPSLDERVSCALEQCAHPFLQQRNLLRVSMRTAAAGRAAGQPLRLTILLDRSGSMERDDRERSVLAAVEALGSLLGEGDQVTVIGFARTPSLLADRIDGSRAAELVGIVAAAPSEGGTNLEEALRLAGESAQRQFLEGAQNRIVLITDGAANLGDAEPESLQEKIIALRGEGIAFDACGVGADGINDEILEALARKGDGRYYFLDKPEDADANFVRQLAGALRPAARNVKVQVKFNPDRVTRYRLSGFEKHRLKKEDFRDDSVDAAEMAAAEAGSALYLVQVKPEGQGPVGEVFVRFQDTASGEMVERSWTIPHRPTAPRLDESNPSLQLAACAGLLAEKLKGGPAGAPVDLGELVPVANSLRGGCFAKNERVQQLADMIQQARSLQP